MSLKSELSELTRAYPSSRGSPRIPPGQDSLGHFRAQSDWLVLEGDVTRVRAKDKVVLRIATLTSNDLVLFAVVSLEAVGHFKCAEVLEVDFSARNCDVVDYAMKRPVDLIIGLVEFYVGWGI